MKGSIRIFVGLVGLFLGLGTIEHGSLVMGFFLSVFSLGVMAWGIKDVPSQS